MTAIVDKQNQTDKIECDSAGTIGYHAGGPADARMMSHAIKRGYDLTSISRKFLPSGDFDKFDMIIGMDNQNVLDLHAMDSNNEYTDKIFKMTDFCTRHELSEVPDPYYGGDAGFELVLDLLEDACEGLLKQIQDDPTA